VVVVVAGGDNDKTAVDKNVTISVDY